MSYVFDPANWEWLITGNNARYIIEGFLINLEIAIIAMLFSLLVGLALALARLARNPVISFVAGLWVDLFRNLPLIFLILYLALALPISWRDAWEENVPGWLPEAYQSGFVFAALVALVLYNSAVIAESHARRHPLPAARPVRGRARAGAQLPPVDAVRDPARRACGGWCRRRSRS